LSSTSASNTEFWWQHGFQIIARERPPVLPKPMMTQMMMADVVGMRAHQNWPSHGAATWSAALFQPTETFAAPICKFAFSLKIKVQKESKGCCLWIHQNKE